jgi:hypothetical protein
MNRKEYICTYVGEGGYAILTPKSGSTLTTRVSNNTEDWEISK